MRFSVACHRKELDGKEASRRPRWEFGGLNNPLPCHPRSNLHAPSCTVADLPPPCSLTIGGPIRQTARESPLDRRFSVFRVPRYRRQVPSGKIRCILFDLAGSATSLSPPLSGWPHTPYQL